MSPFQLKSSIEARAYCTGRMKFLLAEHLGLQERDGKYYSSGDEIYYIDLDASGLNAAIKARNIAGDFALEAILKKENEHGKTLGDKVKVAEVKMTTRAMIEAYHRSLHQHIQPSIPFATLFPVNLPSLYESIEHVYAKIVPAEEAVRV